MEQVGIPEAARILGMSQDTVRRRLNNGELKGTKVPGPGGFRWTVDVDGFNKQEPTNNGGLVDVLKDQVADLRTQLEARTREISELHQLLGARALQPGVQPWWAFWRSGAVG